MKIYPIIITFICSLGIYSESIFSQPPALGEGVDTLDFFTLQALMNDYYKMHPGEPGYKQWKRSEWYLQTRVGPHGEYINFLKQNAAEWWKYVKSNSASRATHASWVFLGPSSVTNIVPGIAGVGLGRLNTVKLHPSNPNIIYVGSSSGGIWKSTNGGASWAGISPHLPSLSIRDIVIYPNDPSKIFVLTGDAYNNNHPSIGILKSVDGGATWLPTKAPEFIERTNKLIIHPTSPEIQYAAVYQGLYKTIDEWDTYSIVYNAEEVFDIEFKPSDPSTIYISTRYGFRKQVNSGPWISLADPDFVDWPTSVYTQIAVSPDLPNCLYGLVSSYTDPIGLYRSLDSGNSNTWTIQDTVMFNFGGQGSYNRTLEVHPENADLVTIGQVWTKVSANGGLAGTWNGPTNYVHADVHSSIFHENTLYHANDGGLFKSIDGGSVFTDLSPDLEITEIYGIAGTPLNDNLYFYGTQDNGTHRRIGGTDFDHVLGADGGNCLINYANHDIVYAMYQEGQLHKSTDGGETFQSINPPGVGAWVTPVIMDPVDPEIIFIGKDTLYRSSSGGSSGSWINLGKPHPMSGSLRTIAQGTSNRNRIYVANSRFVDFKIFRADNAITSSNPLEWVNITSGLPEGTVTEIVVNPDNEQEIFICMNNAILGSKVYKSNFGGNAGTWLNITGSLPNVIFNCLEFHDNGLNNKAIYLGTDIGVFYRDEDLDDWIYFSNNLPVVNVLDLYINPIANTITAGTYGRGLWKSYTYSACVANINLSNPSGTPVGGIRFYSVTNSIVSTIDYRNDLGTEVHYTAGNFIDMKPGFQFGGYGVSKAMIGPCPNEYLPSGFQSSLPFINFDFEAWLNTNDKKE